MNNKSIKAPLAAVLAGLIATSALMAGCGGNNNATPDEAAKETRVVTETQIVTRIVDGVYTDQNGNVIKDENGQPVTAVQTGTDANGNPVYENEAAENGGAQNSGNNSADNNSSANQNPNNGGNQSSNSGSQNSGNSSSGSGKSSNSGGNSDKKGGDSSTLSIGGKTYNVGDKVVCTYSLTSKKLLVNFQAHIDYDGSLLKATNAYFEGQAASGSVLNYDLDSKIKFNGIKLNGYNYTKGGSFFVVEYEVLGGGSASPEFVWEIATDTKDNALISNGTPDASIQLTESYS